MAKGFGVRQNKIHLFLLQITVPLWLTMNIKIKGFFCTSSYIVSHTHIASCIRYLSRQHLMIKHRVYTK